MRFLRYVLVVAAILSTAWLWLTFPPVPWQMRAQEKPLTGSTTLSTANVWKGGTFEYSKIYSFMDPPDDVKICVGGTLNCLTFKRIREVIAADRKVK